MTTWAENLARRDRSWLVYATIQGVGDGDGLWRFSSDAGWTLAAGEGSWRPWLQDMPDILSERVDFFGGGAVESGSGVDLEIVDVGEALTDLLRADAGSSAKLTIAAAATSTTLTVDALPPEFAALTLQNGDVLWLGSEAVEIVSRASGPPATIDVTRAALGTTAVAHAVGVELFVRPRLLESREIRVYLAPLDGSEADARLVGVYTLEDIRLDADHATWSISGPGREPYLDRRCPRAARVATVTASTEDRVGISGSAATFLNLTLEGPAETILGGGTDVVYGTADGDELVQFRTSGGVSRALLTGRGHAGTPQDDLPRVGRAMRRVLTVANGDFRATGIGLGTTVRTSTAFVAVESWVEVLLCILLSPALEDDLADNYDPVGTDWSGRNFSGLLSGYGIGVPYTDVDFDSFQTVAASTSNFDIPFFALGPTAAPFSEVVSPLLRVAGAFLVRERGQLRLVSPEVALLGATPTYNLTTSTVLLRGRDLPAVQTSRARVQTTEIAFQLGPEEVERAVAIGDLPENYDPRDLYESPGEPVVLKAPFLDPAGTEWLDLGIRYLRRLLTSRTQLDLEVDAALVEWALGESAGVDLPGVPDFRGIRGLVGNAQLAEIEVVADRAEGVYARTKVFVQPPFNVGRVSAAADIISVATNRATVECNVYTCPDAPGGLPTSDAAAFTVGDVVRQVDAAGSDTGGGTQIVTAVGELVGLAFGAWNQHNGTSLDIGAPPSSDAWLQVHAFGTNTSAVDGTSNLAYGTVSPTDSDSNVSKFGSAATRGWQYLGAWSPADLATRSNTTLAFTTGLSAVTLLYQWVSGDIDATGNTEVGGVTKGGGFWTGTDDISLSDSVPAGLKDGTLYLGCFMAEGPFSASYTEGASTSDSQFTGGGGAYVIETFFLRKVVGEDEIDGLSSGAGQLNDGNTTGMLYEPNVAVSGSGCYIDLDGNFSGNLAAGGTLIYADHSESTATQTGRYAYVDEGYVWG